MFYMYACMSPQCKMFPLPKDHSRGLRDLTCERASLRSQRWLLNSEDKVFMCELNLILVLTRKSHVYPESVLQEGQDANGKFGNSENYKSQDLRIVFLSFYLGYVIQTLIPVPLACSGIWSFQPHSAWYRDFAVLGYNVICASTIRQHYCRTVVIKDCCQCVVSVHLCMFLSQWVPRRKPGFYGTIPLRKVSKCIFDALYNQWCLHASYGACAHRHELTLSL